MKRIYLSVLLALASCSKADHPTEAFIKDAAGCTPEKVEGGTNLICPTKTVFIKDGADGKDGDVCETEVVAGNLIVRCEGKDPLFVPGGSLGDGTDNTGSGDPALTGTPGPKGDKGEPGKDGKDGKSCSLFVDEGNCLWIQCGDRKEKIRGPL